MNLHKITPRSWLPRFSIYDVLCYMLGVHVCVITIYLFNLIISHIFIDFVMISTPHEEPSVTSSEECTKKVYFCLLIEYIYIIYSLFHQQRAKVMRNKSIHVLLTVLIFLSLIFFPYTLDYLTSIKPPLTQVDHSD